MNKKIVVSFTLIAALTLSVARLMIGCNTDPAPTAAPTTEQTEATLGVKYPTLMTYAEYKKLSPELQQAYYESFPSPELYMEWFNAAVLAYNESAAGAETETEDDNVGELTQPTESKTPSNSGSTTTNKVPVQSSTEPVGSDDTTVSKPVTPDSQTPEETQKATIPDVLTGFGGVVIGGKRD